MKQPVFFFPLGKILPNFNLKNRISIYKGNLIAKNCPSLPDYEEFFFQIAMNHLTDNIGYSTTSQQNLSGG
jgi:hypothetical protein